MKVNFLSIATVALVSMVGIGATYAGESKDTTTQSHEEHHPEAQKAPPIQEKNMEQGGMMGKMDMGQMHSMMNECMKAHKDGKMCEHDTMEKCQGKMKMEECQKMMNETKTQKKKKTEK